MRESILNILFSIALSLLIFAIILNKPAFIVVACILLILTTSTTVYYRLPLKIYDSIAAISLIFVITSDWLNRGYNFFQGPSIKGELILGILSAWLLLKFTNIKWQLLLPISSLVIMISFLIESNGKILFSDDLSVFFYRFQLLKENFPKIPFYNPLWNAGIDARDFFASGSLNFFLLFSPIIYLFKLDSSFNLLIATLLFIIAPAATYYAAKNYLKLPSPTPAFSGLLILSLGLPWYRWALKYGTLGFITSLCLVPLLFASSLSLFEKKGNVSGKHALLITILTILITFWSLSFLILLPLAIYGLLNIKSLIVKPQVQIILAVLLFVFSIWVPIFFTASNVGSFVSKESSYTQEFRHKNKTPTFKTVSQNLAETGISTNPLLIFLVAPGLFLLKKRERIVYSSTILWLLILGSTAVTLKPQLELDRMLIAAAMLAAIPTALTITNLMQRNIYLASIPLGFLLISPFVTASIVRNRSIEHFSFASSQVEDLSEAINTFSGDGRTLFSGFVLHELSNGHLAPLVLSTRKPLIASSYVHNRWKYQQIIPKEFIEQGEKGIEEYLNLMNVTAVLAHEKDWREYFQTKSNIYKEVWRSVPFVMFQRQVSANYFLSGKGKITSNLTNSVYFKLDTQDAVLKYNYFPFLMVEGCKVSPKEISPSVTFTELSGCPTNQELKLESRSGWWRVLKRS